VSELEGLTVAQQREVLMRELKLLRQEIGGIRVALEKLASNDKPINVITRQWDDNR
jgi:hypothetical protein